MKNTVMRALRVCKDDLHPYFCSFHRRERPCLTGSLFYHIFFVSLQHTNHSAVSKGNVPPEACSPRRQENTCHPRALHADGTLLLKKLKNLKP